MGSRGAVRLLALSSPTQALPFEDASVDVLTCCYGFMFPADKALALRECFRVLRPGGTLIATTWDKTNMVNVVKDVMTAVLGKEPPPPPINPLALSEPGLFEGMLTDAGFTDVSTTTSTYPFDFGKDPAFQFKIGTLMVKDKLVELGAEAVAEVALHPSPRAYPQPQPAHRRGPELWVHALLLAGGLLQEHRQVHLQVARRKSDPGRQHFQALRRHQKVDLARELSEEEQGERELMQYRVAFICSASGKPATERERYV